ncbi:MAG: hypothetical protein WDA25_00945 [Paracoccaceae bacterium]
MTVSTALRRIAYAGDGVTQAFPVPFRFPAASDLVVTLTDSAGVEMVQTLNVHFTVSGGGPAAGGTVTMMAPPPAGLRLAIRRVVARTQETDYVPNDPFPAESHEAALDKLTMIAQEDADDLGRALLVPDTDPQRGKMMLPSVSRRAGLFLAFDAMGALVALPAIGATTTSLGPAYLTVAALLADTGLSYAKVNIGARVQAGGFSYQVAPPAAPDSHVETAGGVQLYVIDDGFVTVDAFGAAYGNVDESAVAQKMLDALNVLRVPVSRVLTAKNIALADRAKVQVDGTLRLPDGCADFDQLLHGEALGGVDIRIHEIDGNAAGQSGNIGTHLLYFPELVDSSIRVGMMRDHYVASGAPMPSVDGWRNTSSGPLFIPEGRRVEVRVELIRGWGREAVYLVDCADCTVWVGHAQGTGLTEYSGVQVSGQRNRILRASVDNAGASAVGFDTVDGEISNIITTNTRENHGVNFGHPGRPASRSVASNIVVDGSWISGIAIAAGTQDLILNNFFVSNAGERGLQQSDGSNGLRASNGIIRNSGRWNIVAGGASVSNGELRMTAVDSDELDPMVLHLDGVTGIFEEGETVTGPNGSGTVRRALRNLTGVRQKLFLRDVTGTFAPTDTITGGTSGASGTASIAAAPVQRLEQDGVRVIDDSYVITGVQRNYKRHADGTAEFWGVLALTIAAPNTAVNGSLTFLAGMTWDGALPQVLASVSAVSSTGAYDLTRLQAEAAAGQINVSFNASVAQTYSISLYARGRWK